jgi:ribosomal protein S18 acetylase RimI-like enzyme
MKNLKYNIKIKKTVLYIAETTEGDIVAFTWAGIEKVNPFDDLPDASKFEGELITFYVLENYQRRKIGRTLVYFITEFLIKNNVNSMLVWILKVNPSKEC